VPYNLTAGGLWSGFNSQSAFDLDGTNAPVWIIRNGINDLAQTAATDFTAFHNIGNPGAAAANGNGAVRFAIAVKTPSEGGAGSLEITDGKFVGPSTSDEPEICFTTGGYEKEEEAEVYYAVVPKGDDPPDYSDYTLLDTVPEGEQTETITLLVDQVGGDYDVYVIVYKDGEVSDPIVINTKEGGTDVDYEWAGRFVTVGNHDYGKAFWSEDGGRNWTEVTSEIEDDWLSVAYGDGVFVAVSDGDGAAWSEDGGEPWNVTSLPSEKCWQSVTYGDGVFVAVPNSGNKIVKSQDGGRTWEEAELPYEESWYSVDYGDGVFVTVPCGSNKAAMSKDGGETWSEAELPYSANWVGVGYGDGVFVAVAQDSKMAAKSEDNGETWREVPLPYSDSDSVNWESVTYGDNMFVTVGYNWSNKTGVSAWSANGGGTWMAASSIPANEWYSVTYGGGVFVAVGYAPDTTGHGAAAYSTDGINWMSSVISHSCYSVTYGKP
jgi:hypothetical protein